MLPQPLPPPSAGGAHVSLLGGDRCRGQHTHTQEEPFWPNGEDGDDGDSGESNIPLTAAPLLVGWPDF